MPNIDIGAEAGMNGGLVVLVMTEVGHTHSAAIRAVLTEAEAETLVASIDKALDQARDLYAAAQNGTTRNGKT
jgi:hypothetical protein